MISKWFLGDFKIHFSKRSGYQPFVACLVNETKTIKPGLQQKFHTLLY